MSKLWWELDRISRDLVACGITCLTLFGEGDAARPSSRVGPYVPMAVSLRARTKRQLRARTQRHSRRVC
jgi:hypothetical protein